MIRRLLLASLVAGALLPLSATLGAAQQSGQQVPGMGMALAGGDTSPSSEAFRAANEKMHHGMAVPLTGDTDADFVRGMIPHHQGAVDMAKVELAYGKDPELRKMAEGIIAGQSREIEFMRQWLAAHGK
jgi:uncharacterized protein (DUF305 family)